MQIIVVRLFITKADIVYDSTVAVECMVVSAHKHSYDCHIAVFGGFVTNKQQLQLLLLIAGKRQNMARFVAYFQTNY